MTETRRHDHGSAMPHPEQAIEPPPRIERPADRIRAAFALPETVDDAIITDAVHAIRAATTRESRYQAALASDLMVVLFVRDPAVDSTIDDLLALITEPGRPCD
ncbi:MAG: hypothetical protein AAFR55_02505 [Pseudomonadota bacterium]